jgi:hypothetical protein
VLDALYKAGFRGDTLIKMAGIAKRESSYNRFAHNPKPPDDSYGLFQVNLLGNLREPRMDQIGQITGGSKDPSNLYDPYVNAAMAWQLSSGGTNLQPWGIKPKGASQADPMINVTQSSLDDARSEAQKLWPAGYGDVGVGATPSGYNGGSQTSISHTPVVFNNVFHITPAQGTDTEALARNLSPRLEAQFRKATGLRR